MVFFDTHCHLQDVRLAADCEAVLARAQTAGVTHLVCCGTRPADWDAVLNLAQRHDAVLPMLGLHPWYAQQAQLDWLDLLAKHLESGPIGLGECGLDFMIPEPDRELQETVFRAQLRLARALNRPLSIHCRHAWERLAVIAREEGLPAAGAVIHAFSGSAEVARAMQALGYHLAFGCTLTHPDHRRAAKAVRAVTEDRLLFETDAPDMPPYGAAAETLNEPANLHLALERAAYLRNTSVEALAAAVYRNSQRVFGRMK